MEIKDGVLLNISFKDIENGKLVVPDGVVNIGYRAFFENSEITEVILPDSVISIGKQAFQNCSNLKNIQLSKNLKFIGENAFWGCSEIEHLKLPEKLVLIENHAFKNCSKLKEINFPDSLIEIDNSAFSFCKCLTSLKLSKNIKNIQDSAFENCTALESVEFEDGGITQLPSFMFSGCSNLKHIKLPNNLTSIGKLAFSSCHSLENLNLPKSVKTIEDKAFYNCNSLKSITIPDSVQSLGELSFYSCENLENVNLSNNIKSIEKGTFDSCINLKNINLPENLKIIDENAFYNCFSLKNIKLPESLEIINKGAFQECSKLDEIILPENLKEVGTSTFSNCSQLKSITIPNNITVLRDKIFKNCYSLKSVNLPENLEFIGDSTFDNCKELESITLPKNLKSIGTSAFECCFQLNNISLPESLETINNNAFKFCDKVSEINFPKSLKTIGSYAFSCTSIKNIDIPNTIENFGSFIFDGCTQLETISLPDNLTKLPAGLVQKCENLKEITIPESVTAIENYALSKTGLAKIDIPKNVRIIGYGALSSNKNLTEINIPEGVESIYPDAFTRNENLNIIHIPNSVTSDLGYLKSSFYFFDKAESGFNLLTEQTPTSIPLKDLQINLPFLSRHWDKKSILLKEQSNSNISMFYNNIISKKPESEIQEFLNGHNFTFFKKLNISNNPETLFDMYNFLYNMGVASAPVEYNGKMVDFAQKTSEFLRLIEERQDFPTSKFKNIFKNMNSDGLKPEFVDFFIKNFDKLYDIEKSKPGFMVRCYNEFYEVQKTNTNHHGSQRQLKPTVEKFENYFSDIKFSGIIDEKTESISKTISPFFDDQIHFDRAVEIMKEKENLKTPNNILNMHLKEENPFFKIDEYSRKTRKLQEVSATNLVEYANCEFTYDWIEKNDPQNFILGNLCSCCSHLDGIGYGIMKASIVHPNIQNLTIRNREGEIIAKSTLFINTNEGYGVFNNVEVSEYFNFSKEEKRKIYKKYIKGLTAFAEEYNKQHPSNPLKQINVGMGRNDLEEELQKFNKKANHIVRSINYDDYGVDDKIYNGDSAILQYVVWKNKNFFLDKESSK